MNEDIKSLVAEICYTIEDAWEGKENWREVNGFKPTWILVSKDLATTLAFPEKSIEKVEVESSADVFFFELCSTYDQVSTLAESCIYKATQENA